MFVLYNLYEDKSCKQECTDLFSPYAIDVSVTISSVATFRLAFDHMSDRVLLREIGQ